MCSKKMYNELKKMKKQKLIITYNETNEFYLFFNDGEFEIRTNIDDKLIINCTEKFINFFGGYYLFLTDPKIYKTDKNIIFVQIDGEHVLFVHKILSITSKERTNRTNMNVCEYIPVRNLQKWLDCKIIEYSSNISESKMKNVNKIVYKS